MRQRSWRLLLVALVAAVTVIGCGGEGNEAQRPTAPVEEGGAADEEVTAGESAAAGDDEAYTEARERMVEQGIVGLGIESEAVIAAMEAVPRHRFVPTEYLSQAYENHPLPIGFGQTISQPYVVALMTEEAQVDEDDVVLEIGTGSGYQAAVLAEIVEHVYSMEIIGGLAERAESTLQDLGYENVTVRNADGYFGWEEEAPFDAILVTAAPDHIPQPLVDQLKVGGRMIIPVGPVGGFQTLWRVTKVGEDEVQSEDLGGVRFVPLTREEE